MISVKNNPVPPSARRRAFFFLVLAAAVLLLQSCATARLPGISGYGEGAEADSRAAGHLQALRLDGRSYVQLDVDRTPGPFLALLLGGDQEGSTLRLVQRYGRSLLMIEPLDALSALRGNGDPADGSGDPEAETAAHDTGSHGEEGRTGWFMLVYHRVSPLFIPGQLRKAGLVRERLVIGAKTVMRWSIPPTGEQAAQLYLYTPEPGLMLISDDGRADAQALLSFIDGPAADELRPEPMTIDADSFFTAWLPGAGEQGVLGPDLGLVQDLELSLSTDSAEGLFANLALRSGGELQARSLRVVLRLLLIRPLELALPGLSAEDYRSLLKIETEGSTVLLRRYPVSSDFLSRLLESGLF